MTDYKYECVKVRVHDGIAWTMLNRPDKRNAMSPQLHYDMDDALARLEVDDDVKVVVVTGEGGNFSAGQDLKKFFRELERNPGERKKAASRRQSLALGAALRLRQAHHRHGARLLCRRRVHAAPGLRLRDRGRGRDLLAVGGELGNPARRAGVEGGLRHGAAAPRALLRLPGRAVRRQGGGAHRHGQFRGAGRRSSRMPPPSSPKS